MRWSTRVAHLLHRLTVAEKAALTAGHGWWGTTTVERLGIPAVGMSDGPNGVRGPTISSLGIQSVCLPCGTALASTWDLDLVEALSGTPFGAVEPAQALKPALESLAAALGSRLDGEPTGIGVKDCLEVLTGGVTVLVPLMLDDTVAAFVGVTLNDPPPAQRSTTTAMAGKSWGIDMLRDVEMEVTCELGRTRMTVRQLLALAPGDVVELDRLAGAPADLLVNGTLLARGEVVVVDESFGLRITEIVGDADQVPPAQIRARSSRLPPHPNHATEVAVDPSPDVGSSHEAVRCSGAHGDECPVSRGLCQALPRAAPRRDHGEPDCERPRRRVRQPR